MERPRRSQRRARGSRPMLTRSPRVGCGGAPCELAPPAPKQGKEDLAKARRPRLPPPAAGHGVPGFNRPPPGADSLLGRSEEPGPRHHPHLAVGHDEAPVPFPMVLPFILVHLPHFHSPPEPAPPSKSPRPPPRASGRSRANHLVCPPPPGRYRKSRPPTTGQRVAGNADIFGWVSAAERLQMRLPSSVMAERVRRLYERDAGPACTSIFHAGGR